MKKSAIWILIAVMVLTFASLLTLQYSYIRTLGKMRTEQFDEAVKRSLSQVVRNLELDETARFLSEDMNEHESDAFSVPKVTRKITRQSQTATLHSIGGLSSISSMFEYDETTTLSQTGPKVFISMSHGKNTLSGTSTKMQENLRERYLAQKGLMEDVILRILYEANNRPIEQRVDFSKLENYLKVELENNGLENMPFHFRVTDKNDVEVYRCKEMIGKNENGGYKQVLFPNDPDVETGTLYLYFPTKKNYIYESLRIYIPSIIFSIVLLIVFGTTIIIIFRQKKLNDMKNDFVNNMTHELKTPISTISLAAQMLKDGDVGKTPAMLKHISGVIVDETKRLSFQVEKVLQVSLFERDRSNLTFKEVDVNEMLDTIVATFKLKVENFDGKLEKDLSAKRADVTADEMHLTNVFFNLMDNAVKYRSERDLVLTVHTWNEKDNIMISIQDNGIGIKKDNLKRVFERFYRVPTGNVHDVKGFGLGLAYVQKIVQNHNGTIRAESEVNMGTKFIISLPLIKNEL
ncbi:MAG: HAMP domain-containing sensor histidine kinase [Bacteroidales bacterium]|nr:HAMP domain-containing histidine kinase [Bacteroidales bacterium]MDD2612429.1 HAMP domain-containing sensor histidine kinase [Bacteroidales bacterium]MDD4712202.1 HAMP domain-containing sensor histidine kinase [Bacteroidales bacterium]